MPTANAINADSAGVVSYNGDGTFFGSALTQYAFLAGGANSTIVNIGPGTAGQVLQSGGNAANPAYSTATYPSTSGSSTNVLRSNGTNFTSIANPFFTQVVTQFFTSTGTYTPTAGMKYCIIECIGGGGGGGGAGGSVSNASAGSGGSGGGYSRKAFTAAQVGASKAVTIGAGGGAGNGGGGNGGNGGTTSVGALITAGGGGGGGGQAASAVGFNGPSSQGGTCSLGGTTGNSQSGGVGTWSAVGVIAWAGIGGQSHIGGTNTSVPLIAAGAQTGTDGKLYGGGASGGSQLLSATGALGGVGAKGFVFITEFI